MTWGVACIHGCSRKNPNTPETLESFTFANLAERRSGKAAKCSCADFSIFEGNPVAASRTDFANIQSSSRRRTTRFGQNKAHGKENVGGVNIATVQPN